MTEYQLGFYFPPNTFTLVLKPNRPPPLRILYHQKMQNLMGKKLKGFRVYYFTEEQILLEVYHPRYTYFFVFTVSVLDNWFLHIWPYIVFLSIWQIVEIFGNNFGG